jgi:hypothetical protein
MLLGACVGLVTGPLAMGWRNYPWAAIPFVAVSIVVIHPVMNQDLPSLVGVDMLRSWRIYAAIALNVAAVVVSYPYIRSYTDHFLNGR